eukprot:snap_masked-scaffold_27-processed-gene-4.25-mRNA-1 protein AED:1.00 eAED:1.00 QI:0/0/0/0/1/1/3/0/66
MFRVSLRFPPVLYPFLMLISPALRMLAFFVCSSGRVGLGWRRVRFISLDSLFKALDVPELAAILDF